MTGNTRTNDWIDDRDLAEPSPSTDWKTTAAIMDALAGQRHAPRPHVAGDRDTVDEDADPAPTGTDDVEAARDDAPTADTLEVSS